MILPRCLAPALLFFSLAMPLQAPPDKPLARPAFKAFDVATVKPIGSEVQNGRYFKMLGPHRFVAKNYTLKLLIAAAYDLNARAISGGAGWTESDHFDIEAITPGEVQPTRQEQMTMLRGLLQDRFKLAFHRDDKVMSLFELGVAKGGPKLKPTAVPDEPPATISTVHPDRIVMPARNVSMDDFAAVLQRALLDRPVVNQTGLTGRYDFDLTWAPDETQLSGDVAAAPENAPSPPLFTAVREQLGLKLEAARGPVSTFVIDAAVKPIAD